MRNLDNQPENVEAYGPSTPSHAAFKGTNAFGTLITVGLKATF